MSELTMTIMIVVGVLLIIFLSAFSYKKYRILKSIHAEKALQTERVLAMKKEKYIHVQDSLRILAKALTADQLGVIEGAIRIKVLIDHYDPELHYEDDFKIFSEISKQTEHIPILKEWKNLDKLSKRKYEALMAEIASTKGDDVKKATASLEVQLNRTTH
ncbi:DUF2489 domain-containing protein [Neptunomonas antarctica]|uniref:DUF2489 domain-containing protein n=1 Tax=Neptunomonas antarctica TaxID=619304 RepID=UPI00138F75D3|nr:DUF2489 domain-containing protein [Neptunomonas antarctica]